MAIGDDFSVAANGNIRHISGTTVYSVLAVHEFLQDRADDAAPSGDDTVSILSSNPSRLDGPRASNKPMVLNLLGTFNIDDDAAQYINFGSISQTSGDVLYTGVKSIGSPLVAATPVYVVQNNSKLTVYWPNGHIQIMVKAKTGGSLIDSGDIRAFSRKYGQTYADFSANLVAGGEQPVAISTQVTDWTTLNEAAAAALSSKVAITVGDTNQDSGDGNGSKLYKGTITLSDGCTVAEAAQYLQYICRQDTATTINSEPGWRYRTLNGAYTPNAAAPFGLVAGGKWFVAQGWWIAGALAGDSQKYQMISHDGTTITNPIIASIAVADVTVGSRLLVGRDNGSGGFLDNEYTLDGVHTSGMSTVVVNEVIKVDTPATGYLRVNGVPYTYTAVNVGTKTFTITGTLGAGYSAGASTWVPFIDKVAASTTETSPNFTFNTNFTARLKVRKGSTPNSKKPFETTTSVTSGGGSFTAIQDADE
jgi:hypothetical protein